MEHSQESHSGGESISSSTHRFVQDLLGRPASDMSGARASAQATLDHLSWLSDISSEHQDPIRSLQSAQAKAQHDREHLRWLAKISPDHERRLRHLEQAEAQARQTEFSAGQPHHELVLEWDAAKHPRRGTSPNPGWFSTTGGSSNSGRRRSLFDVAIDRNRLIGQLSGVTTPGMHQATSLAADLHAAAQLPDELTKAAVAGAGTGSKAVVNGLATAIKNAATLGLSTSSRQSTKTSPWKRERSRQDFRILQLKNSWRYWKSNRPRVVKQEELQ